MLNSLEICNFLENRLNEAGDQYGEKFILHDGAGELENSSKTNGILRQTGDSSVTQIMNYTSIRGQFELELLLSTIMGLGRMTDVSKVVDEVVQSLNGVPISLGEGRIIFSFKIPKSGKYECRETIGDSVVIDILFSIEYSEVDSEDGLVWEMALIDNPFAGTINTRYFGSQSEQHQWYLDKISAQGIPFSRTFTPNINSLLIQKQMYVNDANLDVNSILTKNYAIIRSLRNNEPQYYYYYEVQSADIGANNQPMFDLKLDTLQTYYFDSNIRFSDCLIKRAHLDRFKRSPIRINSVDRYVFNFDDDSPLLSREDLRGAAKRAVLKKKLLPIYTSVAQDSASGTSDVDDWFRENVSHWVYYYISSGNFNFYNSARTTQQGKSLPTIKYAEDSDCLDSNGDVTTGNVFDGDYVVLVAPIYKSNKEIWITGEDLEGHDIAWRWNEMAVKNFLDTNGLGNTSSIYSIKKSLMPPFSLAYINPCLTIRDDGNILWNNTGGTSIPAISGEYGFQYFFNSVLMIGGDISGERPSCLGVVRYQDLSNALHFCIDSDLYQSTFTVSNIKNGSANGWGFGIEPKLLNEDYSTYRLFIGGNTYDMPISKTSPKPRFLYKEILTPDITKALLIFDLDNSIRPSNVFKDVSMTDFTGFMINIDLSVWFASDKLSEYLANNKNSLQILKNNQEAERTTFNNGAIATIGSSVVGLAVGAITGNVTGAAMGMMGMSGSVAAEQNLNVRQQNEMQNYYLTLDNMSQSPNTLSSLNANPLLIQSIDELAFYIELQQMLPSEIKGFTDNLNIFGYSFNRIGNIKNYDNKRVLYNYLEAEIEVVDGISISTSIKNDLRQVLANGIRFWAVDNEEYSYKNYEVMFESIDN